MYKKFRKLLYGRSLMTIVLLLLQISLLFDVFSLVSNENLMVMRLSRIISTFLVIYILNKDMNANYKISWIIIILSFPVFGTLLYIYFRLQIITNGLKKKYKVIKKENKSIFQQNNKVLKSIENPNDKGTFDYIYNVDNKPICSNTEAYYLKTGEEFFEELKEELLKAKDFIFLEYFIIEPSKMWFETLEILRKKVKEGVEVRVMIDGLRALLSFPKDYEEKMKSYGIKYQVFLPVKPVLSTHHNNRNHRKTTIIDGKVAFNGGINIADEYININVVQGYWKDNAIKLKGEAVDSLTLMFLESWDLHNKSRSDYSKYLLNYKAKSDGLVNCYADSPFDNDNVGKNVYLSMIYASSKYLYITTPYLIIEGEIINALINAAKRGVDVRIVLPFKGDGKGAGFLAISHYKQLILNGIKVYEYLPGFIHSKMFVSDDIRAIIGTINLDYRSLYLHFENATLLYKNSAIKDMKDDIDAIIEESKLITMKEYKKIKLYKKIIGFALKPFAPLM